MKLKRILPAVLALTNEEGIIYLYSSDLRIQREEKLLEVIGTRRIWKNANQSTDYIIGRRRYYEEEGDECRIPLTLKGDSINYSKPDPTLMWD